MNDGIPLDVEHGVYLTRQEWLDLDDALAEWEFDGFTVDAPRLDVVEKVREHIDRNVRAA